MKINFKYFNLIDKDLRLTVYVNYSFKSVQSYFGMTGLIEYISYELNDESNNEYYKDYIFKSFSLEKYNYHKGLNAP